MTDQIAVQQTQARYEEARQWEETARLAYLEAQDQTRRWKQIRDDIWNAHYRGETLPAAE